MKLHGVATAIYGSAEKSIFSLATLSAENADEIYIDGSQKLEINPADTPAAREAFLQLLNTLCTYRAQIMDITEETSVNIPVPVVHGVARDHPRDAYVSMLLSAFPEYLHTFPAAEDASVEELVEHLCSAYFEDHAIHSNDEVPPKIQMYGFGLYKTEDVIAKTAYIPNQRELAMNVQLAQLIHDAKRGDDDALNDLRMHADREAISAVKQLKAAKSHYEARFMQVGLHRPEFQKSPYYTYLEEFDLKEVFANRFTNSFSPPHNVCIKTPNALSSPAFADITATILADTWDLLQYDRTKVMRKKRHVEAKRH